MRLPDGGNGAARRAVPDSKRGRLPERKRLLVIPGSDHFFTGKLEAVEAGVSAWAPSNALEPPSVCWLTDPQGEWPLINS